MHISEGVLSAPVLITGAVLSAAGIAIGLRKMSYDKIPEVAVLSSAFFVASLIHVPIGPSSVHLVLNGLLGILLGWMAFPSILVALSLQALLFQFICNVDIEGYGQLTRRRDQPAGNIFRCDLDVVKRNIDQFAFNRKPEGFFFLQFFYLFGAE